MTFKPRPLLHSHSLVFIFSSIYLVRFKRALFKAKSTQKPDQPEAVIPFALDWTDAVCSSFKSETQTPAASYLIVSTRS